MRPNWQTTPKGPGDTVESVLQLAIDRLRELNKEVPCRENSLALTHMETGLLWLNERTRVRRAQHVEGLPIPHQS